MPIYTFLLVTTSRALIILLTMSPRPLFSINPDSHVFTLDPELSLKGSGGLESNI